MTIIKGEELQSRIGHHVIHAGHLAFSGDIEAAEQEMQQAVDLLNSTQS